VSRGHTGGHDISVDEMAPKMVFKGFFSWCGNIGSGDITTLNFIIIT
jgi:hypothetical protein